MSTVKRMGIAIGLLVLACHWLYAADNPKATQEREYPFPLAHVETALRQMGAYTGARLPTLEGFITTDRAQLPNYERPYYEFKIELVPAATDHTLVRVKANVSAWYSDPEGRHHRCVSSRLMPGPTRPSTIVGVKRLFTTIVPFESET